MFDVGTRSPSFLVNHTGFVGAHDTTQQILPNCLTAQAGWCSTILANTRGSWQPSGRWPNKPHCPPDVPRQLAAGELLFEFYSERNHTRWRCELRQHPEPYRVEAPFLPERGVPLLAALRRHDEPRRTPREMAIAWAEEWRTDLEHGGV
jgi:hypothetical protein